MPPTSSGSGASSSSSVLDAFKAGAFELICVDGTMEGMHCAENGTISWSVKRVNDVEDSFWEGVGRLWGRKDK